MRLFLFVFFILILPLTASADPTRMVPSPKPPPIPWQLNSCGSHAYVTKRLFTSHGEVPVIDGTIQANRNFPMVIEVFANRATGSWTIAVTNVAQTTCHLASGKRFREK